MNYVKRCLLVVFLLVFIGSVSAACDLDAQFVSQDPYPATPGSYVDAVFQITGLGKGCTEGASVDLILEYPFSLDESSTKSIASNAYIGKDSLSNWNVLYKIRVDDRALEDEYVFELRYKEGSSVTWEQYEYKKFNITLEKAKTNFELHIQDYKILDKKISFQILNTGNKDIEAVTIEVPKQEHITIKGSNRNIIGSLDANEYASADFEAIPTEGNITLNVYYTDSVDERRMVQKTIYYDPSYFIDSTENIQPKNNTKYFIIAVVIILVGLFFLRRHKKKKQKNKKDFKL